MFEKRLLKEVSASIEIAADSFEARAKVYNEVNRESDTARLSNLSKAFKRKAETNSLMDAWELNEQRLEESYFYWKLVLSYWEDETLAETDLYAQRCPSSQRRDIEMLCQKAFKNVREKKQHKWIQHACEKKGCKEGYVTIDGVEKIRRMKCALPKSKLAVPKEMANIMQCCPNTPLLSGKHNKPSRFCKEHEDAVNEENVETFRLGSLDQHIHLPKDCSSSYVEDNDDESVLVGCKQKKNINRFYDRTAGLLAAVRPCGIIACFDEMFTCESPSQVFYFIFNSFGQNAESFARLKFLGYDRNCDFHPFMRKLSKRGNKGATLLLKEVKFLVDKFHCLKHTEAVCMPLENPKCVYHPDLPAFKEIHGTNTECAEQAFRWLGAFKNNCKKMKMHKYCFFLWVVIDAHNKRVEREICRKERK